MNELRELVEFLKANGIAEFDMERDELKVRIKFASAVQASAGIDAGVLARLMAQGGGGGACGSCGAGGCCACCCCGGGSCGGPGCRVAHGEVAYCGYVL